MDLHSLKSLVSVKSCKRDVVQVRVKSSKAKDLLV